MKKIASTGLLLAAFLFGMTSCNQDKGAVEEAQETNEQRAEGTEMEDQMTKQSDFMTKAASGGMMEVELGKLAQQRGQTKEVKDFGGMMVKDHGQANSELKSLASKLNITLPDSMSSDHMDHVKELREKKGIEFDKAYMDLMVQDHDDDISMFEDASNDIDNAEVKAFASKTLEKLRQHHERAKQVKDIVDKKK